MRPAANLAVGVVVVLAMIATVIFARSTVSLFSATGRLNQMMDVFRGDLEAREDEHFIQATHDWRLRQSQSQSGASSSTCEVGALSPVEAAQMAWVTSVEDASVMPAVVALAATFDRFSCVRTKVALVSAMLEDDHLQALKAMGFRCVEVGGETREAPFASPLPEMSCHALGVRSEGSNDNNGNNDDGHNPHNHHHHLPHMTTSCISYHAWVLEDYLRIVYVDPGFLLLTNMDEVFLSNPDCMLAAPRIAQPGKMDSVDDTGINAGLMVLCPDRKLAEAMMDDWKRVVARKGCISEQEHLFHFFSQPRRTIHMLPFAYGVHDTTYYPMRALQVADRGTLQRLRWWDATRAGRRLAMLAPMVAHEDDRDIPIVQARRDARFVFWHYYHEGIARYSLGTWGKAMLGGESQS